MAESKEPGYIESNETKDEYEINDKQHQNKIKILFLDIDGVLNGSKDLEDDKDPQTLQIFKQYRMALLKIILNTTNCKIVLSTAWRRSKDAKQKIKTQFIKNDIEWDEIYIGDTPIMDYLMMDPESDDYQRAFEISTYLKQIEIDSNYVVENWCAVDDMALDVGVKSKEIMQGRFVKTDGYIGIIDDDAIKIINILNNSE
eukprot:455479_1